MIGLKVTTEDFQARFDGIRWIGDVHGDLAVRYAVDDALAQNFAIGFIGDLTDQSPADNGKPNDSADVLRLLIELDRDDKVVFSPGNHCAKLYRYLTKLRAGKGEEAKIKQSHGLAQTVTELMTEQDVDFLIDNFIRIAGSTPLWNLMGDYVFVHAGGSRAMFVEPAPVLSAALTDKKNGLVHRALYGQTDGTTDENGFPTRRYDWVDRLPAAKTVVIGHDIRKEITTVDGAEGGRMIHIDTGAGKGGKLSWLDLRVEELGLVV